MKTKHILVALFAGLAITSCDDFLTCLPETSVPKEGF